jgi:hypothetical protein
MYLQAAPFDDVVERVRRGEAMVKGSVMQIRGWRHR